MKATILRRNGTINEEIDNIAGSLTRIGILIYMEMLQCPNLKDLKTSLNDSPGDRSYKYISESVVAKCEEFICNEEFRKIRGSLVDNSKSEQVFPCSEGNCIYIDKREKMRKYVLKKLKETAEALVV